MRRAFSFRVDEEQAGRRLDQFLATRLGGLSRMRIGSLVRGGACSLNGETVEAGGLHLACGDLVEIAFEDGGPTAMSPEELPLEIPYEDEDLLVVVKPAGVLVHPTLGVKSGTLANALAYHLNRERIESSRAEQASEYGPAVQEQVRPGLVHRLDRATSGLMVVARHQRALSILSRHFHHRLVEKRYLALVQGTVAEDELVITAPVGRDELAQPRWRVMPEGRHAETRLRTLERLAGMTLLELEPVTGRTNQLRIHCAHLGHPIVGDELYNSQPGARRLALHASRLGFHHPSGGRWMEFHSPLPAGIRELM